MFRDKPHEIGWWIVILSAFVGSFSHVLLGSIMHSDMEPLAPFSRTNALLGLMSSTAIYQFCLYAGMAGAVLYFTIRFIIARQHNKNG